MNQCTDYKTGQRCCCSETVLPSENDFIMAVSQTSLSSNPDLRDPLLGLFLLGICFLCFLFFIFFTLFSLNSHEGHVNLGTWRTWYGSQLAGKKFPRSRPSRPSRPITGRGIVESFFLSSWTWHISHSALVNSPVIGKDLDRLGLTRTRSPTSWKDASDTAGSASPPMETTRSCRSPTLEVDLESSNFPNFFQSPLITSHRPLSALQSSTRRPRASACPRHRHDRISVWTNGIQASRSDLQHLSRFGIDDGNEKRPISIHLK